MNPVQDRYRLLFENLPAPAAFNRLLTDPEDNPVNYIILDANRAFTEMTGLTGEQIIGKKATEVMPDIMPDIIPDVIPDMIKENPEWMEACGRAALKGENSRLTRYFENLGRCYDITFFAHEPGYFSITYHDITPWWKDALDSKEQLRLMTRNISDIVFETDLNGRYTYISPSYEQLLGRGRELAGCSCFDYIHPADREQVLEIFMNSADSGRRDRVEYRYPHPEKGYIWLETVGEIYTSKDNEKRVLLNACDITERKQAEEELRKSEEKYRLLSENAADVIWTADMDLTYTYLSPSLQQVFGYEPEELLHCPISQTLTPSSLDAALAAFQEEIAAEHSGQSDPDRFCIIESEHIHKNGSTIWVEVKMTFLRDDNGHPAGILGITRDITERKQIEEIIQESEARNTAVLNAITDILFVFNRDGDCLDLLANDKSLLLASHEKLIGANIRDRMPAETAAQFIHYFQHALDTNELQMIEEYALDLPGGRRYFEARITAIDEERVLLVLRDITDRVTAEQTIKHQLKNESVISEISSAFVNFPSERTDEVVEFALKLTGEIIGAERGSIFLFSPDKQAATNTHEWCRPGIRAKKHELQNTPVTTIPWLTDKLKRFETVTYPRVADMPPEAAVEKAVFEGLSVRSVLGVPIISSGKLLGYMGFSSLTKEMAWSNEHVALTKTVAEIISAALTKYQVEEAYLETLARMNALMVNSPNVITIIDKNGKLIDLSAGMARLLGLPPPVVRGKTVRELFSEKTAAAVMQALAAVQERQTIITRTEVIPVKGEERIFETRYFPVKQAGDTIELIGVISMDITQLQRSQQEALQASQAKSEFMAKVSHELRTPLHAILNYADFGLDESREADGETLQKYFEKIHYSGSRLLDLINDLLDLSRFEAGSLQYIFKQYQLYELALSSGQELDTLLSDKKINLEIMKPDFAATVKVDRARILQVLRNLIHNAIKFSPPGGRIVVEFTREHSPKPAVAVHITDEGPGIEPEDMEVIFKKFRQGKDNTRNKEGTGLGLAICREIITAHTGRIYAANASPGGARFTFVLPLPAEADTF